LKPAEKPDFQPPLKILAISSFVIVWLGCFVVFLVRVFRTFSFHVPWLITTSGFEEEALFSLWKFTQGQVVYSDPRQIPFSASYFNWGFYFLYGSLAKLFLGLLHLPSVWLPMICRLTSLSMGLTVPALFFLILKEIGNTWRYWSFPLLLLWCLIPIINPICGLWIMTARPDIAALVFEMIGLFLGLRYLKNESLFTIIWAAIIFYAAFSFKQNNVSALGGVALTLLLLRKWPAFGILCSLWLILVLGTLAIGGSNFRYDILLSQAHCKFSPSNALGYSIDAIKSDGLLPLALIFIAYMAIKNPRASIFEPRELMLLLVTLIGVALAVAGLFKTGAATNYFMPAATWSALWLVLWAGRIPPRVLYVGLILSSFVVLLKLEVIVFKRSEDLRAMHAPMEKLSERLASLPGPTFVVFRFGNLPWIQPHPPYFVRAYSYEMDEEAGVPHEAGGWEGLIIRGYFNTVVSTPLEESKMRPYLTNYELILDENGYEIYRRKASEIR
jgi:hypothetical protein